MTSPFSSFGSMESPTTLEGEIGKGNSMSPRPSEGTCSLSGSITVLASTQPVIGTLFNSNIP